MLGLNPVFFFYNAIKVMFKDKMICNSDTLAYSLDNEIVEVMILVPTFQFNVLLKVLCKEIKIKIFS